ncbi:hypothetical protein GCM10009608_70670 [Pseudonocardia alaniniphila]
MQYATTAAITNPTSSPPPAAAAAGANTENTPAPIIEPSPITTASDVPRRRTKAGSPVIATPATACHADNDALDTR